MKIVTIEVRDVLEVTIELRPPRKGELGWFVRSEHTPEQMLREVIDGRDTHDVGAAGFGWVADYDHPDGDLAYLDEPPCRYVTVHVREIRVEVGDARRL